jgi:hypothetical protein
MHLTILMSIAKRILSTCGRRVDRGTFLANLPKFSASSAGDVAFAGTLLASADASEEDRDRLLEIFRALSFERFLGARPFDASTVVRMFEGPAFVTGLPTNAFGAEYVVLIPEDGDPATVQIGSTSMGGVGYSAFEPKRGDIFRFGGDSGTPIDGAEALEPVVIFHEQGVRRHGPASP